MWQYGKLPDEWQIKKIGEYTSVITDYVANGSFAALAENVNYKSEPGYAVLVRLTDYNNGFEGDFVYIDEHAYEFLSKSKLYGGEIIISNVGANVGTVFKCPKLERKMSLAPNAIMLKTQGNDDFYYYWFTSRKGQHSLQSIVTGSAQPKFNKTNFRELLVPVPPLNVQEKIAESLSHIDRKIALNKLLNKNLEQQLQLLYEQLVYMIKGEIVELSSIIEVRDGTHASPKPKKNGFPLVTSKHLLPFGVDLSSCNLISQEDYNKINERSKVDTYDILLSMIGTVGLVSLVIENPVSYAIKNVGLFKTSKRPDLYAFILPYLKSKETAQHIERTLAGSTQKYISLSELRKMPIILPAEKQLSDYNEIAKPLINQIITLTKENGTLIVLRDTLLPKLMSGEIDISGIDI